MALYHTEIEITSDMTTVFAERRGEVWAVSFLSVVTVSLTATSSAAVTIAEELAKPDLTSSPRELRSHLP